MKKILFIVLTIISLLTVTEAQSEEWKFFGGTTLLKGEKTISYYDTESIEYGSIGNIKVWTKTVTQSEFQKIVQQEQSQIVDKSAKKIANGYVPPYSLFVSKNTNFDEVIDIVTWEEVANSFQIKPRVKILFEINCKEKRIRTISVTYFKDDGGVASSKNSGEWSYISPESNGETLQIILCK